jgi:hypothetical protein
MFNVKALRSRFNWGRVWFNWGRVLISALILYFFMGSFRISPPEAGKQDYFFVMKG